MGTGLYSAPDDFRSATRNMTRHPRLRLLGCGPILLLAAGCYVYVPVPASSAEPGRVIRASLTEGAAADLTPVLGPGVQELEGLLVEREDSTLTILVESYRSAQLGEWRGYTQPIHLPAGRIATLEQKRFALGRSLVFSAAMLGVALLTIDLLADEGPVFEPEPPDDPGPVEVRVPSRM